MTSYDIIGNIAILKKKDMKLAKELLKRENIKSIYEKSEKFKGRLRKATYKWLAGDKKTETFYRENNCVFFFDINKTYFSPRLATERLEIAKQVKKNEKILVMFSGVSPYSIVIAKNSKPEKIIDIELNREAVKYAKKNVELNKIKNIEVIQGDVKKVVSKLKERYNRVIMARPQLKYDFLKEAFAVSKKGTIIHFYDFRNEKDFKKSLELVKQKVKESKKKIKILKLKKAGELAPYKFRMRIDFKVLS
ncbi:tRNA (guanine-N1)-methyltransferase [Candidatus Pacearchaeota archaeon CG_4_9_14_3_um_filter_31_7]|nr:MAG: hypothetical protein AUJ10_01475 [Candidatus Pacearchaeota archaeon CG1_02_31_27]PIN91993.1 MAG: tRNA (guanine-N1)-methyltransferase [Candidatus Pacearchaeota archaeon CG10_big_fil_rev_8_21_14_0_10_31_59]PIZ81166.1 MAG: tRNA (guanine-N1)-methyltransferase [Candidatus Pacearchaeota archaeon CG_4_10_14_0_2_um_filter_31_10]PJA70619.1 MAG: tRNA (guanine-N1)-methyltransferase [Candidatus Pacearchaeota archaeon CG_4_9_14_3_um_filter_31_7]